MKVFFVCEVVAALFLGLFLAGCSSKSATQPAAMTPEVQQRVKATAAESARVSATSEAIMQANQANTNNGR